MIHSSRSMGALNAAHNAQSRTPPPARRPHANTVTERPMGVTLPSSPPTSRMLISSPPHSPRHIQNHLYQMFLEGQTADVSVVIRGSWEALYKLHRVILIQSDYFRTLFTNGFLESSRSYRSAAGGTSGDVMELHFDDPNITRAAFEICIARLYGGGPDLFVDPALVPSNQHPLTQSFPIACAPSPAPQGSHPATPRFLLSLLATANFLHIPSVTTQALLLVLSTIGPWTISRYFGFAIGQGIGAPEGDEPQSAVGLDAIGQPAPAVAPKVSPSKPIKIEEVSPQEEEEDEDLVKVSSLGTHEAHFLKDRIVSAASQLTLEDTRSVYTYTEQDEDGAPMYFYGVVGDKIGEACACWLARWGADILTLEEAVEAKAHPPAPKFAAPFPGLGHSRSGSHPPATPPSPTTFSPFSTSASLHGASQSTSSLPSSSRRPTITYMHPMLLTPTILNRSGSQATNGPVKAPSVWSHNGLCARWARAVICSDDLFVRGEWERFVFATRVVELRRRQLNRELAAAKGDEAATKRVERLKRAEEREWAEMFKTGIYYSHISLEDMHKVSQEMSSTGKPFVDLATLQSAHWRQSILRSQVTSRSIVVSSRSNSPAPIGVGSSSSQGSITEGELGGLVTTSEILASGDVNDDKIYFPVPCDASVRIGHDRTAASTEAEGLSLSDMDVLSSVSSSPGKVRKPATERDFFGLRPSRRTAKEIAEEHVPGSEGTKWSANEPFRFSVEFWGLDTLKEKNRLHSQTIWYAGSMYNVYVQVIKKKGLQLGMYLHRQSAVDPIPPASAPASFVLLNNPTSSPADMGSPLLSPLPQPINSPHRTISLPGTTPVTSPPTPTPRTGTTPPDRDAPVTSPPYAPVAPWRDPRRVVRSYFVMSCPSLIGSSLTRFQSGPDDFKISQSWGWKSSCLWHEPETEEALVLDDDTINSLRATVMIGVV